MAKFCTKHGKPLDENGKCPLCEASVKEESVNQVPAPPIVDPIFAPPVTSDFTAEAPVNESAPVKETSASTEKKPGEITIDIGQIKKGFADMKNNIGAGDPELNKTDAFEKGKLIVPDCVKSNEDEIPVKQYTVAKLRKRFFGIPYATAIGRIQVTNQRVIFRAPGKSPAGRTTLQHEFIIDEVAGIEARREYIFDIWSAFFSIYLWGIGGFLSFGLLYSMKYGFGAGLLGFIIGVGAMVPWYLVKKKWWLKLLTGGISMGAFLTCSSKAIMHNSEGWGAFFGFFFGPVLLSVIYSVWMFCIRPNLVMIIKTKGTSAAVDIRRKKQGFLSFGASKEEDDHTGYTEIVPEPDAEISIRELGAMIHDIQKLGDFGVEKWKDAN